MATDSAARLRLLAAEVRAELVRCERTAAEVAEARIAVANRDCPRLTLYGAAALLETLYTGVEKTLSRIALAMGGVPEGGAWHRRLLDDATLDLPKLRPPVLAESTVRLLEPFLAFRHRFRNLYLFDLDASLISPLLTDAAPAWRAAAADLSGFAARIEALADALEQGPSNAPQGLPAPGVIGGEGISGTDHGFPD